MRSATDFSKESVFKSGLKNKTEQYYCNIMVQKSKI